MKKGVLVLIILFNFCSTYGQVGVNTSSPTETLDVNGTIRVRNISPAGSTPSVKDSIVVFDSDGVFKYTSADAIVAQAAAGISKVVTN